jgi:hypothetical protein
LSFGASYPVSIDAGCLIVISKLKQMKKYVLYLCIVFMSASILMSSCSKDDDDMGTETKSLQINGVDFIPNSACELWHNNTDNSYSMHLWDGSLQFGSNYEVSGEGDWLELYLHSNGSTPSGNYTVSYSEEEGCVEASFQLGVFQTSDGYLSQTSYIEFTSGTVEVESTNDPYTYKVILDLTGENGETFKGTVTVDFRFIMQVY